MIDFKILASTLAIIAALILVNNNDVKRDKLKGGGFKNKNTLLNIYDEPLIACGSRSMSSGSWDSEFKCSEKDGGVHQICINHISKNAKGFSMKTGQSNWSDKRGQDNHCVCLGAWSLYSAKENKQKKPILKCEAIPKIAFSKRYVSKFSQGWNKWNGLELNNQIKHGVESLFNMCYNKKETKSENLKSNYCSFAKTVKVLKDSDVYKKHCI